MPDALSIACERNPIRALIASVADRDDVKRIAANVGIIAEFVRSIEQDAD